MKKLLIIILVIGVIAAWWKPAESSYFNVLRGLINDTTPRDIRIDSATHTLQTITYEHHEVHAGSHFIIANFVDIAQGADTEIVISTKNSTKWAHMIFQAEVEAESTLTVFEDIAADNDGTAITPVNSDRNSATTAVTVISSDSTITDEGTVIAQAKAGSGKKWGGGIRGTEELVLKQNTKYSFRVSNDAAQVTWASLQLTFYEHTNKG